MITGPCIEHLCAVLLGNERQEKHKLAIEHMSSNSEENRASQSNGTHHRTDTRRSAVDLNERRQRLMRRGYMRAISPSQSVLKHGNATNEAEHAGAFHSMSRPFGASTVSTIRSPRDDLSPTTPGHTNVTFEEALDESTPMDDPLAHPSIDNVSLIESSGNDAAASPDGSTEEHVGEIEQSSQLQFKRRLRLAVVIPAAMMGVLAAVVTVVTVTMVMRNNSKGTGSNNAKCGIEAVIGLCRGVPDVFEEPPPCLVDRYHHARTHIPLFDSGCNLSENSCLPANLAVWSIAATAPKNATLISILHRYVLGTLFFETKGPTSWYRGDKWLTAESECSWYGVSCNEVLEGISLPKNGLSGPLPSQLGLLPALCEYMDELVLALHHWLTEVVHFAESVTLDVGDNRVSGKVPSELGSIETLSTFLDWSTRCCSNHYLQLARALERPRVPRLMESLS